MWMVFKLFTIWDIISSWITFVKTHNLCFYVNFVCAPCGIVLCVMGFGSNGFCKSIILWFKYDIPIMVFLCFFCGVGANMVINNSTILGSSNLDCLHMFKKNFYIIHKILNDFGYFTFILFVPNLPKCYDDIYYWHCCVHASHIFNINKGRERRLTNRLMFLFQKQIATLLRIIILSYCGTFWGLVVIKLKF